MTTADDLLWTEREARRFLKLGRTKLYSLRKAGRIPFVSGGPFGRSVLYDPAALRAWIGRHRQGGQGHG